MVRPILMVTCIFVSLVSEVSVWQTVIKGKNNQQYRKQRVQNVGSITNVTSTALNTLMDIPWIEQFAKMYMLNPKEL